MKAHPEDLPGGQRIRRTERRLLSLALLVVVGAYVLLGLASRATIGPGTVGYATALVALAAVAHLATRRFAPFAEPVLLPATFLLNGLGLVFIRRIDLANGTDLAVAQTIWTVVGIGLYCLVLMALPDHRWLTRYRYTAGLATLVLLLLPLAPVIGREINGARLWVDLGIVTFQPGELAKLTLVVFLAGYLDEKRALLSVATNRVWRFLVPPARHLAPVLAAALGGIAILVAQTDLGSSLLFFGVFVTMLYVATGRAAYPALGGAAFAVGGALAYLAFGHVAERFAVWLDPWQDIRGSGYQIAQSLFALGTGGLTGAGIGLGHPTVPEAATDLIFAVIGEELGLLGTTAVLLAYLLIVAKGLKTAMIAADDVGTLITTGLSTILALQVFVIVGGVTRLIPLTGITLPWVSYGGSSLISNMLLLALLVRVSDSARAVGRAGGVEP